MQEEFDKSYMKELGNFLRLEKKKGKVIFPKGFDIKNDYKSKSFLNVPLKNHKDKVIGVLQLLNAKVDEDIVSYSYDIFYLVESLSSQASMNLESH